MEGKGLASFYLPGAAEPCCPQRRGEEAKISVLRPSVVFSLCQMLL